MLCCAGLQVLYWALISTCMLAGASSSVGSLGAAVAVEREHVKVLCGDHSAGLRKLNAGRVRCQTAVADTVLWHTARMCSLHPSPPGGSLINREYARVSAWLVQRKRTRFHCFHSHSVSVGFCILHTE